ncbi:MAG TPA: AraC family transcriptional regulator [Dehalococcoidia bacterium]|nr:AraC family transcriptional regulator [Dehalococcoidia bacterium]
MEWSERMNAAIDYIEKNLAGEVDLNKAAGIACCSTFHFQRMFFAINGLTPVEYTRRRRLTLAATEVSSGTGRIIDIAMKYGYDSPNAFTRAFRNLHGVTPTAARELGVTLTAFPRISFHIQLIGGNDMNYRIIKKPAFTVALTSRKFTTDGGQNLKDIPKWWQEFMASPEYGKMTALSNSMTGVITGGVMLGVCYRAADTGEFSYGIAVELPEGASPGKFERMEIPATTWAVFDCTLANLQDVTKQIFGEWYMATGYEHPGTPDLEVYLPEGTGDDMKCQIWAPVVKKK